MIIPMKTTNRLIGGKLVPTVSARELHAMLEAEVDFPAWIESLLSDLSCMEHLDFSRQVAASEAVGTDTTGKPAGGLDYYLTENLAMHCAILEPNDHGKQVREYLVDCERHLSVGDSLDEMLAWMQRTDKIHLQ